MSDATDLKLLRASMLLDTDPAAAMRCARAILVEAPGLEPAHLLMAEASRRLGEAAGAPALPRGVDLDAGRAEVWLEISRQRLRAGDVAAADAAYREYRALADDPAELAGAYAAFDGGQLDIAESFARRILRAGSCDVAAHTLLAAIAARRGDDWSQEAALREILRIAPCDGMARENLATLLVRQSRTDEALLLIQRLLGSQPGRGDLLILEAEALRLAERHAEGLAIIDSLIAEQPDNPDLRLLAGNLQRYVGRSGDAVDSYRRALGIRRGFGMAWWALSNLKTYRSSAEDVDDMRVQADAAAGDDAIGLEFALGAALEERAEFAAAFEHYERANQHARATFKYDAAATTAFVGRFENTFGERFFAARGAWGNHTVEPIFIVGLPRSGSTLVEQILASHSAVEGTRELPYIPVIARQLAGPPETARRYPESLASLGKHDAEALALRYLADARRHRVLGRPRFIDKMHGNFASLGLIHLMFPRAVIIDARRHPLGCGFGCYKQLFNPGMNFAYDLREIGLYYRDYARLMAHLDAVLPLRVYRVDYERLVADTAQEVRALLDHCGLPFEAGCLNFHENPRVAQTISSEQVRRPIYSDSVDQWRHFEPYLGPLQAALGDLLEF